MKTKPPTGQGADIVELFATGLNAVDAYRLTERCIRKRADTLTIRDNLGCETSYDLSEFERILIAGFGKAAYPMARAIEQKLHERITRGVVITPYGSSTKLRRIDIIEAGHPVPDMNSLRGARLIAGMMDGATESDIVILLVSGGGSALCTLPAPGLSVDEVSRTTDLLLRSGASIDEINTIRKHLSQIKGGQLAKLAHPAEVAALIISDVIGDPPHAIASGPAAPDPSTFSDASRIISKYKIAQIIPPNISAHLEAGCRGEIPETPKPGEPFFEKTRNFIIGNNIMALQAIADRARQKGYRALILSSRISGDTRNVAKAFASVIMDFKRNNTTLPLCIISGGEMTAAVKGTGTGGRNQDFCLSMIPLIKGIEDIQLLSAGTDGIDGNTDAAGAIVDGNTYEHAMALGIDIEKALANYDANTLLKATENLLMTGPTGTNVMDVQIILLR
jgi:glycerate 2-kinase